MAQSTFTVNYPNGFLDKKKPIGSGSRIDTYTQNEIAAYGNNYVIIPKIVKETSIILQLEELILTFNNIIKTYKFTPDKYLELNKISDILTNEELVVKYALIKLNGTHGRCIEIKNYDPSTAISFPIITYNPILKETKKYLLKLFNRFLYYKDKNKHDIIMYEGHQLFIHLFAIIIDSFHFPNHEVQIKKNCTDTFSMITLLDLLLNKKYKNILNFHINNIPLPLPKIEVEVKQNDDDDSVDDEWDKDDFNPFKLLHIEKSLPLPPEIKIPTITITYKTDAKTNAKTDVDTKKTIPTQIDDTPDDWASI